MSAPTLPPGVKGVSRFDKATRPQPCASPWECSGVQVGQPAAYFGVESGLLVTCGPCADRIEAGELNAPQPEPAPEPQPEQRTTLSARLIAEDSRTCWYRPGECGGVLEGFEAAWVQRTMPPAMVCGPCADLIETVQDGPAAMLHQPDATEVEESDADRAADAAHAEWVADTAFSPRDERDVAAPPSETRPLVESPVEVPDVHECECTRVTKRAKFGRTPDGRPTHEHCGGVLREKHQHLAPAPEPTEDGSSTEQEAQSDDGDPDADHGAEPVAGGEPGAGVAAGSAHGAARRGEGGDEGGHGAGEGDHRRDQGRGDAPDAGGGDGGGAAQPAHGERLAVRPAGELDVRLEGVQEGEPADLGGVGAQDGQLAARPDGLTDRALGGLAAFYAQPADEDDVPAPSDTVALATFDWSLLADEGEPVNAPDSDNYLGEFSVAELLAEVVRRPSYAGDLLGVLIRDSDGRIVTVPA